tara:strand:+ start:3881 stop:4636 length:756 start_codon:yes stop_codon:yes gene_type:complete
MALDFGEGQMTLDAKADSQTRQQAAQDEHSKRGLFGSIGGLLGTFLPVLLAPVTGGLSLAASAVLSGVGAAAGQAIGRNQADKAIPDIKTKFGQADTADMYKSLDNIDNGAILKSGLSAATSSYMSPMMGSLSDNAAIDYVTKSLPVGSDAYNQAISGLNLRNPQLAYDSIAGGIGDESQIGGLLEAFGLNNNPVNTVYTDPNSSYDPTNPYNFGYSEEVPEPAPLDPFGGAMDEEWTIGNMMQGGRTYNK